MTKKKIKARFEKLLSKSEFPLLHELSLSVPKDELYSELQILSKKLSFAEEEDDRCMRRAKRHDLKALCTLISGQEEERMLLTNISETGLKAMISDTTSVVVSHNKKLKIQLRILREESRTEIIVDAKLIRIIEPNNGYLELCFDFLNIGSYELERIRRFIEVYAKGRSMETTRNVS